MSKFICLGLGLGCWISLICNFVAWKALSVDGLLCLFWFGVLFFVKCFEHIEDEKEVRDE